MPDLYVGNLNFDLTSDNLLALFVGFGPVHRARVVEHEDTGRSGGYGFVTMATCEGAERAIAAMDGRTFMGRPMKVKYSERSKRKKDPPAPRRTYHED